MGGARETIDAGPPGGFGEAVVDEIPDLIGGFPQSYLQQPLPGRPAYGPYIPRAVNRYFEYDQWRLFTGKSPEYVVALQNAMVGAGLVDPSDLTAGWWGDAEADGMKQLLIEATANRTDWQTALRSRIDAVAASPSTAGGGRTFVTPTYLAPDYASLAQAVKSTFGQLVGREPKDYELALLADQLAADSRREYEAQVAASRAEFTAATPVDDGNHPLSLDAPGSAPSGDRFVGGATVQGVDPMARLREAIAGRWGGEIAAEEDEADFSTNSRLMAANLAGLSSVAGG